MTGRGQAEIHARVLDGPLGAFPYAIRDGRARARAGRGHARPRRARRARRADRRARSRCASTAGRSTLRVVGRHVEPDDDGRGAVTALSSLPAGRGGARRARTGPSASRPAPTPCRPPRRCAARAAAGSQVERPIESLQREAADMRPVVYGTVALLIVIAALNLLTTLGLAVRERERDYAVLASVGATPRQVRTTVIAGGAALALPAALLGLPLGRVDLHARDRRDRPRRRPRRPHAPGLVVVPGRDRRRGRCWPPRSARSPRAPPRASARRRRCAPSRSTVRRVSFLEMLAVAGAGVVAGAVNAIVGSGSLVTFPTLLAVGYPPVTANVSNTVGLVFGGVSGAWGYRRELRGQRRRVLTLACGSAVGALVGGILLLELPDKRVRRRRPDPDPARPSR